MSKKENRPTEEIPERWPHTAFGDEFMGNEEMAVSSATECTGLIPSSPGENAESASYSDIYGIPTPFEKWNSDNNIGMSDEQKINMAKKSTLE